MNCPFCSTADTRVVNSRPSPAGDAVRRRRECRECGQRFTTLEYIERVELTIVKRNGEREPFEAAKLLRGVEKACEKRPVSKDEIRLLVSRVERDLLSRAENEVSSEELGILILKYLKDLDVVAYMRFASVYKQFRDLHDFAGEIEHLMKD